MKKFVFLFLLLSSFFTGNSQVIITTVAGTGTPGYGGDGTPATAAQFKYVEGVIVDPAGNLYITDQNYYIRKVSPSGVLSTYGGNGTSGYGGDGSPATNAQIGVVTYLALDKKGNLYLSDRLNKRIRKIDQSGIITTVAGTGSSTVSGIGGPATAAGLGASTSGICFDDTGSLFIVVPSTVYKVDTFGIITTYAGTGISGFSGDGGLSSAAQISGGGQIATDAYNNIYLTDIVNHRVRKITPSGIISTFAGNGISGTGGDGGWATSAQFNSVTGVFADKCNNIYLTDATENRIRVVNTAGIITTVVGTGVVGYTGDNGAPGAATLNFPSAICFDKSGNLYISDHSNHAVRKITYPTCLDNLGTEIDRQQELHIYPIPAYDKLNIQTGSNTFSSVTIINSLGQSVLQQHISNNDAVIDVHHLPAGIYMLQLKGEQYTHRQQFVKM